MFNQNQPRIDEITFNGLDRPAMFAGAPLKPLGAAFIVLTIVSILLSLLLGGIWFLTMVLIFPIFFGLRYICEKDENALRVLRYSIKYYLLYRFNIVNFSLTELKKFTFSKNPIFNQLTFLPIVTFKKGDQ